MIRESLDRGTWDFAVETGRVQVVVLTLIDLFVKRLHVIESAENASELFCDTVALGSHVVFISKSLRRACVCTGRVAQHFISMSNRIPH